ncbi:MAG TPA: ABC transporter ATP-binding protein [Syntrophomonadaceae bacterium]|jgi:oligopeptide transport system ATP-binding protein|nr:ABC transporter ATP-binding protein [Syntrophomonadaceae bacterium]
MTLLEIENLYLSFYTYAGEVQALRGINFQVNYGEAIGIVGESGSGKSVSSLSIMGLLPPAGKIKSGRIAFEGRDLLTLSEKEMQQIRGNEISMIFQDPMTSLNPVYTVGDQIMEPLMLHQRLSRADAARKAVEMLTLTGMPDPERRFSQYPHEFSGGMRQRAMIAMALSCRPKLLIADEPTTALDVTIQAQILHLMKDLKNHFNTSIIMITHDLGVVAELCSRILVMYGGTIVEEGSAEDIFYRPAHPYTRGLLRSIPDIRKADKEALLPIDGQPPDLLLPPPGCPFWPRCQHAMRICAEERPGYHELDTGHRAACWLLHPSASHIEGGQIIYE